MPHDVDHPQLTATVPEVARLLRINRTTAYDLINSGRIPHVRIGRAIRVPRAALDTWLATEAAASTQP